MSTTVTSVTKHFPSAQDGFSTTTSGSTASGATTVQLNSVAGYTNGDTVVFIIEPTSATAKQAFTGVIDTSGVQVTGVVWTSGTNQTHAAGVTVVDYETATHWSMLAKGLKVEHNEDGTHGDITADSITTDSLVINGATADGWNATGGTHSVATGYNSGNRSFEIDTSTDVSGFVSEGMRYRVTRNTTPPTQCTDLEASSSQYASKSSPTGITFTDDFTCEAWVKLESYGANCYIASRFSTTGWGFDINTSGQVDLFGNGGNSDRVTSYQSIPLRKWVHVAATLDMSGTAGNIYIDGVLVPSTFTNGASSSITQAGNLQVGGLDGANFFDGKISDVRVWSDIRSELEIQDNMYGYPSDTTGLVAHFKLNGDFTDDSSNGNDLTAQNSAVATDVDNPWNATEYGIITNVTASTIQVFCPEGYGIPNETLTAPFYSTQSAPYGFPRGKGKWSVETICKDDSTQATPTQNQWYNLGSLKLNTPVGEWELIKSVNVGAIRSGQTTTVNSTLSTTNNSETNPLLSDYSGYRYAVTNTQGVYDLHARSTAIELSSATDYYLNIMQGQSSATSIDLYGSTGGTAVIKAECAYL